MRVLVSSDLIKPEFHLATADMTAWSDKDKMLSGKAKQSLATFRLPDPDPKIQPANSLGLALTIGRASLEKADFLILFLMPVSVSTNVKEKSDLVNFPYSATRSIFFIGTSH
jgi:hypothetical protein